MANARGLRADPDRCRNPGRLGCPSDVRSAGRAGINQSSVWPGSMVCGVHRDLRSAADYPRMCCAGACRDTIRCRALHHVGILVHGVNVVRQSGSHDCSLIVEYVCRNRTDRSINVHCCAIGGNAGGCEYRAMALAHLILPPRRQSEVTRPHRAKSATTMAKRTIPQVKLILAVALRVSL